ncbi:MAG: flavodoxin family protein [Thermoguttaceae bacterium]|nr:flavodoxin family protein [Thermoguttaceae bacterium]
MKTIIVNGSPRKNWNTAQLLKEAKKGAESVGAEVEYVDLADLKFSGCRSCLACKRAGVEEPCKCYWKDDLAPLLEIICAADKLIVGAPIYFGEPSGIFRCFVERLFFILLTYNGLSSQFKGKIDVDVFLTMNVDDDFYRENYEAKMRDYFAPMGLLNGQTRIFPVCDTLQVDDYSKYEMGGFSEEHKKAKREADFPAALNQAFNVGAGTCS